MQSMKDEKFVTMVKEAKERLKVEVRRKAADNGDMAVVALLDVVDLLTDNGEDSDLKSALMAIAAMRVSGFGKAAAAATTSALFQLNLALGVGRL